MSLLVSPSYTQSNCPAKCSCIWKNGKQTTNCESQGLISIPSGIQASTQVLNLNSNNFQILPNKVFQERGLNNLQKVFLSRCKLGVVAKDAFLQLTNLVELDLSWNLLTTIPSDSFEPTPALRRLVLNNNPIQRILSSTFSLTPNLNSLDLSDCQIESVADGSFKGLSSLQYLKLEGNRLTTLSFLVLQDLPPLYSMDLHKNPWNCDCLLRPAREWMLRNNVPQSIPPTCAGPEKLNGMMWNSLELDEFACSPSILSRDTDITAMIGTNASFTCITRAQPEARVSWLIEDVVYRNLSFPVVPPHSTTGSSPQTQSMMMPTTTSSQSNTKVPGGDKFSFTEDRSSGPGLVSATLTIMNLEASDSGKSFVCYAENSAGMASKSFTVSVMNLSGTVVGGWTRSEVAGGVILSLIGVLVLFLGIIFLLRSKRFKDTGSSSGSTSKGNHHQGNDNGSASSSSSTNSHKSTASTTGSFPTIDVLKNVPVSHSTPSPLGTGKEMIDANGQLIGYNLIHGQQQQLLHQHLQHMHHQNHFNHHLHHVHPYTAHDPTELMVSDQQGGHPAFVSSPHVYASNVGPEYVDGYPQQLLQQQHYYDESTQSPQMFSSASEEAVHLQMQHQQGLYGGHQPTISSAVITSTSSNSLNQLHHQHNIMNEDVNHTLSTLNPETIPVSGTCVICEQPFTDLRFHYMDFHEIRECIV